MTKGRPQPLAMWLIPVAVALHSVVAWLPPGALLCLGCDAGGWSLGARAPAAQHAQSCCAAESPDPDEPTVPASGVAGCDCTALSVESAGAAAPLPAGADRAIVPIPALDAIATAALANPPGDGGRWSAAVAEPPWDPPLSRRTVLRL